MADETAIQLFEQKVAQTKALDKFTKQDLLDLATDELGVNIGSSGTIDQITEQLLSTHAAIVKASQQITAESATAETTEEDPLIHVRFQFLECPRGVLEFAWNPTHGIARSTEVNGIRRGVKARRCELRDGVEYDLPASLIEHLHGLVVKESEPMIDEDTGHLRGSRTVTRSRCACLALHNRETLRTIGRLQKAGSEDVKVNSGHPTRT